MIVRCVICAWGVVGVCVPPVVVWLHLVHFQIPVWVRCSVLCLHCGHLYFCLVLASIVAVILLSFLPYRAPYLPLVPVFFPFFFCCVISFYTSSSFSRSFCDCSLASLVISLIWVVVSGSLPLFCIADMVLLVFVMIVSFAPATSSSSSVGSSMIVFSSVIAVVAIGRFLIGSRLSFSFSSVLSWYLWVGILVFSSAAVVASVAASMMFPLSLRTWMSMNMIQTFSPGVMHSCFRSIAFDSLMPRSITRASSIASSLGGPASKFGDAIGGSSMFVIITPSSGVSGNGSPGCILIPAVR